MTFKNSKKRKQTKNKKIARQTKRRQWRNHKKYEKKRREEAKKKKARINYLRKLILANDCTMTENEISQFLCILDMVFHNHSYRVHVTYMYEHSDSGNVYGLERIPSKSCLHDWTKHISFDIEWVTGLLLKQAGDKVIRNILGDASGFANMKYGKWEDAKQGVVSRRMFDKLHILMMPHGEIIACMATDGRRHDSPVFREMYGKYIPPGDGYVMLDGAFTCKANCKMVAESGRTQISPAKSNMKPKGFDAMARMLREQRDDPEGFDKKYHQRSLVETAFSVIKERFGATVRAKLESMRALQLTLKCVCYNLIC